ncbi:MAG: hypothetical protein ACOYO1_02610 [Bacteroidales bacterium]
MKTLKIIVYGIIFFFTTALYSQVSINVNIGSPPQWGPAGYNDVSYYYLPDVESYYDVRSSMFIYYSGGNWIHRSYLPARYRNYDLYRGYKVVMKDYRGNRPYDHFKEHKSKYRKGYRDHSQKNIGERPGKGNSDRKMNSNNRNNQKMNQNKERNPAHGQGKNMQNDRGHGGGKGKNK